MPLCIFLGAVATAAAIVAACASSGAALQIGAHVVTTCYPDSAACSTSDQCCGALCHNGVCSPRFQKCVENNGACSTHSDCCTGNCDPDGICGLPACVVDGLDCGNDDACCSHKCVNMRCQAPPDGGLCVEDYDPCSTAAPCCSGACDGLGFCGPKGAAPRCADDLITCHSHTDCCSSYCNPTTGVCGFPANPTNCFTNDSACKKDSDCCSENCSLAQGICGAYRCVADGGACDAGGQCCDLLYCTNSTCAPCIVNGDPCHEDLDCCSSICSHGTCSRQ